MGNKDNGITLHCFRCGRKEWIPHGPRSLAEIMATRRADADLERAATMPSDAVDLMEGPSAALLWVLAGGLQPELANDRYGFRWHETARRVLIPLSRGVLGRAVHGERPKYRIFGSTAFYRVPGSATEGAQRPLVVVEDVLSAIAIERAGWPALALLGTSVSSEQVAACAAPRVIAWFDGDSAGNAAYIKLRKGLALYPTTLTRITTEQDPKRLFRSTLVEHLEGKT